MATKPYISDTAHQDIIVYNRQKNIGVYIPELGTEIPKKSDYENGYMYRYFFQQANDKTSQVKEITKKEYNKIKNNYFYRVLKIKWKIIGDGQIAKEINGKIAYTAEKVMPGIKADLSSNLLLFWRNLPDTPIQFDVTHKLPRVEIKKKVYNVNVVSVVGFDERGFIYILTEDSVIIYTEDSIGILAQL